MPDPDPPLLGADVVVVGGGTAGCVLAAELSADAERRVLLLEAGPGHAEPSLAGMDYLAGAGAEDRFWGGAAAPGQFALDGLVERVAGQPPRPYRSGRGIGGSAAVNGMVAVPPTRADVEGWDVGGSPRWTWQTVEPAVGRLAGGWSPTPAAALGPLERALGAAAAACGVGSFSPVALERSGGRRNSVAERILAPVLGRPNLTVVPHVAVDRLTIEGGRCTGVCLHDGDVATARVAVVLAAGAIRSPLLLARSGLTAALDGGRLTDHPSATFTLHLRRDADRGGFQTSGALRWRTASGGVAELLPIDRVGPGLAACTLAIMDPASTGSISRDGGSVTARLGMLDAERDRIVFREAMGDALRMLATRPVDALAERVTAGSLGFDADALLDAPDAVLDAWVAETGPLLHAACSLPLGSAVDDVGRVPGVVGLHVADASVLPVLPAVAPNATVTVVASVLAGMLRAVV